MLTTLEGRTQIVMDDLMENTAYTMFITISTNLPSTYQYYLADSKIMKLTFTTPYNLSKNPLSNAPPTHPLSLFRYR